MWTDIPGQDFPEGKSCPGMSVHKIFPKIDSYFQEASSGNIDIKTVDNTTLEDDYILSNNKTVAQNRKYHVEICKQYLGQTWSDISKKYSKYKL
jgi:hypothetical protein